MITAVAAAAFSHQQATDKPDWKTEDSQTYATAREFRRKISNLHKTQISTTVCHTDFSSKQASF